MIEWLQQFKHRIVDAVRLWADFVVDVLNVHQIQNTNKKLSIVIGL